MGWFKLPIVIRIANPFPPATSFAEGQRMLFGWLMAMAGVFCGFMVGGIVFLLWLGGWSVASEGQRLTIITIVAIGALGGMISVIVGLMVGGPVGRFKGSLTQNGGEMEVGGRDEPVPPQQNVEVNVNG